MSFVQKILDPGDISGGLSGQNAANASLQAASMQQQAANYSANLQHQQFLQMQANLEPYMQLGTQAMPQLMQMINNGGFQFNPTQAQLEQTPGYQFTLQQGLKGVDNSMSAKGLNLSGAQMKGIDQYNTGLASNTYQQQYQNALQQYQTNYGNLANLLSIGQNAAAGVGNAGLQNASNIGNTIMSGANAGAAGQIGAANATTQGSQNLLGAGLAALAFLA